MKRSDVDLGQILLLYKFSDLVKVYFFLLIPLAKNLIAMENVCLDERCHFIELQITIISKSR